MSMGNQLKTVIFLGLLTGILLGVGYLIGGTGGITVALIISIFMNFLSYWFSDKIVLFIYRAKETNDKDNPRLFKIIKSVSQVANLPMPKVYIINSQNPNMFATGRNENHAAVAATTGILSLLDDEEIKGVIAHEIAHIKNKDILISSIAATIAGTISYIAAMARWAAIFGGFGGNDRDKGPNILEFVVLAIITPILATLIQLAISRSREYNADETGAKIIHNSKGLATALEKLEVGVKNAPLIANGATETTAHMMIVNPFRAKGLVNLFSTHPSTEERVKRLKKLSY